CWVGGLPFLGRPLQPPARHHPAARRKRRAHGVVLENDFPILRLSNQRLGAMRGHRRRLTGSLRGSFYRSRGGLCGRLALRRGGRRNRGGALLGGGRKIENEKESHP